MFGGGFTVSELRAEVADNSVGFLSSNSPRNGNGLSAPETSTDSDDEADFRDARETLNSPESQTSLARTPRPERPSGCEGLFCAMQIAYNCKVLTLCVHQSQSFPLDNIPKAAAFCLCRGI